MSSVQQELARRRKKLIDMSELLPLAIIVLAPHFESSVASAVLSCSHNFPSEQAIEAKPYFTSL